MANETTDGPKQVDEFRLLARMAKELDTVPQLVRLRVLAYLGSREGGERMRPSMRGLGRGGPAGSTVLSGVRLDAEPFAEIAGTPEEIAAQLRAAADAIERSVEGGAAEGTGMPSWAMMQEDN